MPISAVLRVALNATVAAADDYEAGTSPIAYSPSYLFTTGTGNYQATSQFSDQRTLIAAATETIDLQGQTDRLCNAIVLTKLKVLVLRADFDNVGDMVFGPNSTNGFLSPFGAIDDRIRAKPGSTIILVAPDSNGYAVSATNRLLFVQNTGAVSNNYAIAFVGVV